MAAFNWLLTEQRCPACHVDVELRAQLHVGADFAGDESGRFADRDYRVGDVLAWWPPEHPKARTWWQGGRIGASNDGTDEEACCATCPACGAHLYVIVRVAERAIEAITDVGLESAWPQGYFA